MKIFLVVIWGIAGLVTLFMSGYFASQAQWQQAIYFLVFTCYADWNFHRLYNEAKEPPKPKYFPRRMTKPTPEDNRGQNG